MKKFIYYFTSFVFLLALIACSHDEAGEFDNLGELEDIGVPFYGKDTISFTLTLEDGMRTRASVGDNKTNLWEEGDEINFFDGIDNCRFILSKGAGTTSGRFSGVVSYADNYTYVYPYTESAKLLDNGDVEGIVLPSEQTATAGSYDPKAILMMGNSASISSYPFYNGISYAKFKTDFPCSKVVIRSPGINRPIAGKGTIKWNEGVPLLDLSESNEKSTTITLSGEILANQLYYIIIPPGCLTKDWLMTYVSSEDGKRYIHKMASNKTIYRNEVSNFGSLSKSSTTYWIDFERGTVTDEQEVDLGLTIMQDGKNYKVIFANSNLTAYGLAANEAGFGDYFAWAATEPWSTGYEYTSGDTFIASTWLYGKEEDGYTKSYISSYDGNVLKDSDDAARDILGGKWQIPTIEILNLLSSCACEWTTINNVAGYKFTNNGNSIFLPAAGQFDKNMYCESVGVSGYYRVNSTNGDKKSDYFVLQSNGITQVSDNWGKGCTIRPVRLEEITTE